MRAVVFANGVIQKIHLVKPLIEKKDLIVSADGGLRYIRSLSLTPKLHSISQPDAKTNYW